MLQRLLDHRLITSFWARLVSLTLLAFATFFLPYCFAVKPSVSLSYLVQYNNRVAVIVFVLGAFVYALLTGGAMGREDLENRALSYGSLIGALLMTTFVIVGQTIAGLQTPYGESGFNINRMQMLAIGLNPYHVFDYCYGPLNLYMPWLFGQLRHGSMVAGYFFWWITEYLVGIAMLWFTVRQLPYALRWRPVIFWLITWLQLLNMPAQGIQYTPVRLLGTAFCVMAAVYVQDRWRNAYLTSITASLLVAFELGISAEQGIGVAGGLLCWFSLLTWKKQAGFSLLPMATAVAGMSVVFLWFYRIGLFISLKTFSSGAYSLPLLPSLHVVLILFAYVASACAAVQALRTRSFSSAVLPLAFTGAATLPAAFGRADEGHLQIAFAGFLLGIAYLQIHPLLRRVWSTLVFLSYILPVSLGLLGVIRQNTALLAKDSTWLTGLWHSHPRAAADIAPASPSVAVEQTRPASSPRSHDAKAAGDTMTTRSAALVMQPPCPVIYYAPTLWLPRIETTRDRCIDTGYYIGITNVFTAETIQRKIDEMAAFPRRPMLLTDLPLNLQFPTLETDISMLAGSQGYSPFVPKIKRDPMTFQPIIDFIQNNYVPDLESQAGLRIWRPKVTE